MNKQRQVDQAQDIHRAVPHSVEAEMGVLGSMLISPREIIAECVMKIGDSGDHFYVPAHGTIYLVLVEQWKEGKGIDLITFTQILRDRNLLETVGGAVKVTELFTFVPTAANITYYLEIVRDKFIRREIIACCTEMAMTGYDESSDVNVMLDAVQARLSGLMIDSKGTDSLRHVREGVMAVLERFEIAYKNRGQTVVTGLGTGFHDLDRMLAGLKPQQVITIAGMTSQGKTALATNIAEHVALVENEPCGIWSMEMSYDEQSARLVCSTTNVSLERLRDGFLSRENFERLPKQVEPLLASPFYIDDTRGVSIIEFKARARMAVMRRKLKLIIVDQLQLISSTSRQAQDNRAREISDITSGLKSLAKELQLPLIMLSHVNRDASKRALLFRRPKLSDLKDSSSIEQDSDAVLMVWRPGIFAETIDDREQVEHVLNLEALNKKLREQTRRQEEIDGEAHPFTPLTVDNYAEIIVLKNRNGAVSKGNGVPVRFVDDLTRFENVTPKMWSNKVEERQAAAK